MFSCENCEIFKNTSAGFFSEIKKVNEWVTLKNYFVGAGMDFNPTLPYLVVSNLEANKEYTFEVGSINREFNYWCKSLSYRNQSINLLYKSMDWGLYVMNLRHERVKSNGKLSQNILNSIKVNVK